MDFYLELTWKDSRLKYNLSNNAYLPFDWTILDEIWKPYIYFTQFKYGYNHEVPEKNLLVFIYPDGKVMLHKR